MTPTQRFLIDSSILIPYIRQNQAIMVRLDALSHKYVSPTIVAELAYGGLRSHDPQGGLQRVRTILTPLPTLDITQDIAWNFAAIKNILVMRNQLIPETDIWIAVTAMVYNMTLIARDAHFTRIIPFGLLFQQW